MNKQLYIFRNSTVEHLFKDFKHFKYSDYGAISDIKPADIYVWFYTYPIKNDVNQLISEINNYIEKLNLIVSRIPSSSQIMLITLYNLEANFKFENNDRIDKTISSYNDELYRLQNNYSNIQVIDIEEILTTFKKDDILDFRHYYLSQIVLSPKITTEFSHWFSKKLDTVYGKRKKCIVLDLDNTLWGGILGEDLIEGIKLNEEYPGKCYLDFQELLLEATKYGIILAICSKNNISDVEELWEKHPYIRLKKENFSAIRINWNDKATNIREIANELNIGLDSLVFIDDNPRERELVKTMLPEVNVPDFPEKPYLLRNFFITVYNEYFQTFRITDEDRKKVDQYKENVQRIREKSKYENIEEYLKDLNITIQIQKADEFNLPRIAQMTQKTNQFNLTTRRYTEQDLLTKIKNGSFITCASVSDKFGDNGITIGIIIDLDEKNKSAKIDSYFLSCRILGRKIEYAFIKYILNTIHDKYKVAVFKSEYIPTKRNGQTMDFYENLGFNLLQNTKDGIKKYELKFEEKYKIENYYKIEEKYD
jgi:FkbH-like protein